MLFACKGHIVQCTVVICNLLGPTTSTTSKSGTQAGGSGEGHKYSKAEIVQPDTASELSDFQVEVPERLPPKIRMYKRGPKGKLQVLRHAGKERALHFYLVLSYDVKVSLAKEQQNTDMYFLIPML